MESKLFPKLVKDFNFVRKSVQKDLELSKSSVLNFIVLDFMFEDIEKFAFIQIKSMKISPQLFDKQNFYYQLRVNKGLDPVEKSCDGFFCNRIHRSNRLISFFIEALIFSRLLSKNFLIKGANLDNELLFQEYLEELKNLTCYSDSAPFINLNDSNLKKPSPNDIENNNLDIVEGNQNKNFNPSSNPNNTINILAPLLEPSLPYQRTSNININIQIKARNTSINSYYTCDLCHKMIKLYMNKKELLEQENQNLLCILKGLKEKEKTPEYISTMDFYPLIQILEFNIPKIDRLNRLVEPYEDLSPSKVKMSKPNITNIHNIQKKDLYYFGYKPMKGSSSFKIKKDKKAKNFPNNPNLNLENSPDQLQRQSNFMKTKIIPNEYIKHTPTINTKRQNNALDSINSQISQNPKNSVNSSNLKKKSNLIKLPDQKKNSATINEKNMAKKEKSTSKSEIKKNTKININNYEEIKELQGLQELTELRKLHDLQGLQNLHELQKFSRFNDKILITERNSSPDLKNEIINEKIKNINMESISNEILMRKQNKITDGFLPILKPTKEFNSKDKIKSIKNIYL